MVRHIYLSPHADDVALSCGGQIIANSARHSDTLVLTVFTSQAPETDQKPRPAPQPFSDLLNAFRNTEDRSAWQALGVGIDYIDLPEALLRKRFPFRVFTSGTDEAIIDRLCAAIRSFIALYPDAKFYFPAGFGNHVDHLACRNAAFRLLDEDALDTITLYEDIPYCWLRFVRQPYYKVLLRNVKLAQTSVARASRPGGLTFPAYLRRAAVPFPRGRKLFVAVGLALFIERLWQKFAFRKLRYRGNIRVIGLSDAQMARKKALLFEYKSQIPMLFGAHADRLLDHAGPFATEVLIEISRLAR